VQLLINGLEFLQKIKAKKKPSGGFAQDDVPFSSLTSKYQVPNLYLWPWFGINYQKMHN